MPVRVNSSRICVALPSFSRFRGGGFPLGFPLFASLAFRVFYSVDYGGTVVFDVTLVTKFYFSVCDFG